jgi:hypothetical protein
MNMTWHLVFPHTENGAEAWGFQCYEEKNPRTSNPYSALPHSPDQHIEQIRMRLEECWWRAWDKADGLLRTESSIEDDLQP